MTSRQREGIMQTFGEGALIVNSLQFAADGGIYGGKIVKFAVLDVYAAFKQEDIIELAIKETTYKVLVMKIEHKGDCCVVRGLIKSEAAKGGQDALGS